MRRFLFRLASQWCFDCERLMWPWQRRCGGSHTPCSHGRAMRAYLSIPRNVKDNGYAVPPWDCSWCGRSITTEARP